MVLSILDFCRIAGSGNPDDLPRDAGIYPKTDTFQLRTNFPNYYKKALHVLGLGVMLLALWLILLISNALEWSSLPLLAECLLAAGGTPALLGIFFGSLLDYLSLRRASKPSVH